MNLQIYINEKLEKIYEKFREDKGDKTGWSLIQSLKQEANYEEGLIQYFIYSIFKIAYQKGEIINIFSLITELISYPYHKESYLDYPSHSKNKRDVKEVFPRLFMKEDVLIKVLGLLQLKETQRVIHYYFIIKNEEIDEENYLSKKQISEFKKEGIDETRVLDVFREEYKQKKLDKKPKIIRFT